MKLEMGATFDRHGQQVCCRLVDVLGAGRGPMAAWLTNTERKLLIEFSDGPSLPSICEFHLR